MKNLSSFILTVSLAFQPILGFAAFTTPQELGTAITSEGAARSFSGELHGTLNDVEGYQIYVSSWVSGQQRGTGIRDGSMDSKITLDVSVPKANAKVRAKLAMRMVNQKIYLRLESFDSNYEDAMSKVSLSFLMKKWIEFPLSSDDVNAMENAQSNHAVLNDIFDLQHTKTKSGNSYFLRLKDSLLQEIAPSLGELSSMNFLLKIDTNTLDKFLSGKMDFALEETQGKISITAKSQRINMAPSIIAPKDSVSIQELLDKHSNQLDILPSLPSISDVLTNQGQEEEEEDGDNEFESFESGMNSSSWYVEPEQNNNRPSRRGILEQREENQRLRRERRTGSSSSARSSDALESNVERDLAGNGLSTGYRGAPVTIVEFGDYECPFCARFHTETLPKIFKDYIATEKVRFVFRNYPLSFHPNANSAAMAVECARDATGDAVWLLHEAIFKAVADGTKPTPDYIEELLVTFGLSTTEVKACIKEGRKQSVIDQDIEDGYAAEVSGTPSFWILGPNGKAEQINGAQSFETFKEAIDRMLK